MNVSTFPMYPLLNYYAIDHLNKKDYESHEYIKMVDFLNVLKLNHEIVYYQFFLVMTGNKITRDMVSSLHDNLIYLFNCFNNIYVN